VTEGDAVGIQFVLVTAELEPFPHVALSPVFRVDRCPVGVTGCIGVTVRNEGWGSPEGDPGSTNICLSPSGLKGCSPEVFFGGTGHLLCREDQRDGIIQMDFRAREEWEMNRPRSGAKKEGLSGEGKQKRSSIIWFWTWYLSIQTQESTVLSSNPHLAPFHLSKVLRYLTLHFLTGML
jgi:hypothetical protein